MQNLIVCISKDHKKEASFFAASAEDRDLKIKEAKRIMDIGSILEVENWEEKNNVSFVK